jgi:hypothetical protein
MSKTAFANDEIHTLMEGMTPARQAETDHQSVAFPFISLHHILQSVCIAASCTTHYHPHVAEGE